MRPDVRSDVSAACSRRTRDRIHGPGGFVGAETLRAIRMWIDDVLSD